MRVDELTTILEQATAAIEPGYFHLNVDGGDPVYRERVYCYELYHQMRMLWPEGTPFYLNGEIDKAAHPILTELGAGYAKPDLLIHRPGYMSGNYAIIEVKSPGAQNDGIRADLEKLSLFITAVGYQRATYLLYGYEAARTLTRVQALAKQFVALAPIELWVHSQPGSPAVLHK
jgi:hypothetical protein